MIIFWSYFLSDNAKTCTQPHSEFGLRFLKFRPQNPFLGKFAPKTSGLSISSENWHIWYLGGADSVLSGLRFLKFRPQNLFLSRKSQSFPFCLKTGSQRVSRMLILIPTLVLWISNPKSIFGQIWAKKALVVYFSSNLSHRVSWG